MDGIKTLQPSNLFAMQSVWTLAGCEDAVPRVLIEKTFGSLDYVPEFCIGHFQRDKLAGFACGTLLGHDNMAGIRLLVVDPAKRKQGLGTSLLLELEARMQRARAVSTIRAMAVNGNYFTPGVDPLDMESTCFAEKHGYRWVVHGQNMLAEVRHQRNYQDDIGALSNIGYQFLRGDPESKEPLFEFLKQNFPHWEHAVRRSLMNDPPTVHLCKADGVVVGVACAESNNVGSGALGPFGVHPSQRGKGIGKVLLNRCVDDLRRLGFDKYIIDWTNPALNRFFKREFGATRHRIYWIYDKQIS